MIKAVTVTNHLGESLTLELRSPEKSGFFIRNGGIDGLGPVKANVNMTEVATMDGAAYNSARANKRTIVFNLGFIASPSIEATRHNSYRFFPLKRKIKIVVETDDRICETYGYVESNDPDIFSKAEGAIITVVCPGSYLYSQSKDVTVFSSIDPLFSFPFSNESLTENLLEMSSSMIKTEETIVYSGDTAIGVVIYIHALGPVTGLRIDNIRANEFIGIDDTILTTMLGAGIGAGDDVIISTVKGDKYVRLVRGGVTYNIINARTAGSSWFQIDRGDNLFIYTVDTGLTYLQFRIESQVAFEGI